MKIKYFFALLLLFLQFQMVFPNEMDEESQKELFQMPLEELMSIKVVSSSFTDVDYIRTPASITIITKDNIALTPARNLNDLLETYVPGSIWMVHYDGPHPAIRGIAEERNVKILLLVNGKNMNQKIRNGAVSELENWDLGDIERIEIIRGPGSVIYGPGAIEAVINVITKSYESDNVGASVQAITPYKSYGAGITYSKSLSKDINLYSYFSFTQTMGLIPKDGFYFSGNNEYGDVKFWQDSIKRPLQDLYQDSDSIPQIKAHIQLDIGENTTLWARYNNSGTAVNGITKKAAYQTGWDSTGMIVQGPYVNFNQTKDQHFTIALDNKYEIDDVSNLHSVLSFDSENSSRSQDYIQMHPIQWAPSDSSIMFQLEDKYSLRNRYFAVAENELNLKSIYQKIFSEKFSAAFGIEYSFNYWRHSWSKPDYYIRLGDHWNVLSDENSPAYGFKDYFGTDSSDTYFVGGGWSTNTYSVFGEANWEPYENTTILLSGRIDKDDYSDWLISPRFAIIWKIREDDYLKLIAQRSLRMNTAEELLLLHLNGNSPKSEKMDNIELIFTKLIGTNLLYNFSTFISWMDILSWNDPLRSTILSGRLNLWGIEADVRYYETNFDITLNHAFYKQISWKLEPGIFESGISYSDYNKEYYGAVMVGTGNDLNNIPQHTTKFAINIKLFKQSLALHADARMYWNFPGAQDGMDMMKAIIPYSSDSTDIQGIINLIEKYDTYGPDFRVNASVNYTFWNTFSLTLYGMNLIDLTHNKRLRYDTGSKEEQYNYIMKNGLIVEPLTIGLSLKVVY